MPDTRTQLESVTGRVWFILESLETMPEATLEEAREAFVSVLSRLLPG